MKMSEAVLGLEDCEMVFCMGRAGLDGVIVGYLPLFCEVGFL